MSLKHSVKKSRQKFAGTSEIFKNFKPFQNYFELAAMKVVKPLSCCVSLELSVFAFARLSQQP